jgi:hypothetical protein
LETREITPNFFLYSVILPAIWLSAGGLVHVIAPSIRLGAMGLAGVVFIYSWIVGWRFSKRFNRHLTIPEAVRLIAYSSCWAIVIEILGLYAYTSEKGVPVLDLKTYSAIGVAAAVDVLFISAGILRVTRSRIESYLNRSAPPVT